MEYVVRIVSQRNGQRRVQTIQVWDRDDANYLARRLRNSSYGREGARRDATVCVVVPTAAGRLVIEADQLDVVLEQIKQAASDKTRLGVIEEDERLA